MEELKPCPFCGGKAKVSFKDYAFYGRNELGDKKIKYRVQVICNRCRSRGKPIITDWLVNPNPYISKWENCGDGTSPKGSVQTEMFKPYIDKAIEAWNRRAEPQWIPCSERLPEEAYPVIVTWKNDDPASYYQFVLGKHYTGVAHYKNGKWFWYSSITEDVLMEYGRCGSEEFDEAIKVLAWMPLPEPYMAERRVDP